MHARVHSLREERRPSAAGRPVAHLLADLLSNLQDILAAEIRFAQAEAREELRSYRSAAALIGMGVLGGLLSVLFVLVAIVAALSLVLRVWAAALIVAFGMAVVCAILLGAGTRRVRRRAAKAAEHIERIQE